MNMNIIIANLSESPYQPILCLLTAAIMSYLLAVEVLPTNCYNTELTAYAVLFGIANYTTTFLLKFMSPVKYLWMEGHGTSTLSNSAPCS